MSYALGPPISNRFAGSYQTVPKPHLRERLAQQSCLSTELGCITCGPEGRLSFVPSYVVSQGSSTAGDDRPAMPMSAFQPGAHVRVTASVTELLEQQPCRFSAREAESVVGHEGVVVEHRACRLLGLVVVYLNGLRWAFMPQCLTAACPAGDGDKWPSPARDEKCPF
ncbi:hypothetical protein [Azohydromonas australica]|uniref:hypothetical protein n=1 Tax=Azohydromonas australica TaxID=364039 RepID=UPI00048CD64A|nr:hypothetical protein [Azohydromonas australica]